MKILCAIISVVLLSACVSTTAPQAKIVVQPDTVYMGAAGWVISHSPNMPVHPTASGNGWYIDFPSKDGVHYVMVPYAAHKPHQTLTITYRVTGTRFVSVETGCNEAADFRPILERTGDTLTVDKENYRWWSSPPVKLVGDGQVHKISYALQWSNWTSVFGKKNQAEFDATMKDLMGVGITFGGGCFAGHGVYGSGRFELLNYEIK